MIKEVDSDQLYETLFRSYMDCLEENKRFKQTLEYYADENN